MRCKTGILLLCLLFELAAKAQQGNDSVALKTVRYAVSVKPLYAGIFIHSHKLDTFRGDYGVGFQIDYNRYRLDPLAYSYAGVHYNSGFGLQYVKFSHEALGQIVNLSYFIEPYLIERPSFQLRMRAAGGLNLATRPFDRSAGDTINRAFSSHVNAYLGLGFSAWFKVGEKTHLFLDATYSHFSNGNTRNPNLGLNYPNVGVGIEHDLRQTQIPLGKILFYKQRWRFDVGMYGCNKSLPYFPDERFWAYGGFVQASYRSGNIHAWTAQSEVFTDPSMRRAMDANPKYVNEHYSHTLAGVLGGHEFLFNRCIFSQQLGVYVFKEVPPDLVDRVYHRWGFSYKLNRHWMLGTNLNANLQKAFMLDARLVYCWYK